MTIMTRKGSLIPKVFMGSAGHAIKLVLTLAPVISITVDCISLECHGDVNNIFGGYKCIERVSRWCCVMCAADVASCVLSAASACCVLRPACPASCVSCVLRVLRPALCRGG